MSNISKHHAEHEGECHDCQLRRIGLSIGWNTIGVNDFLKGVGYIISFEQSWRIQGFVLYLLQLKLHLNAVLEIIFAPHGPKVSEMHIASNLKHIQSLVTLFLLEDMQFINLDEGDVLRLGKLDDRKQVQPQLILAGA